MYVILADDEKSIRMTLGDDIKTAGHEIDVFDNGEDAFQQIQRMGCDVLICDLKMPGMDGITLLRSVKELYPMMKAILITGFGTVETAVEAMKYGAYDFVVKPFLNEKIVHMLENISDLQQIYSENTELKKKMSELDGPFSGFHGMIGTSSRIQEIFKKIENIASSDASVLIEGESGTGKELVACAIHALSPREKKEMIVLSCAAIPDNLIEDELFGHEPGAYTGAISLKKGKIERADGSTLFIDDIDDMSPHVQAKLIRVLQEHTFERLGGVETIFSDFRIVTATKKNLKKLVDEGIFREDLYFRLNIIPLRLPPLRERQGDIEILVHFFINKFMSGRNAFISDDTMRLLQTYSWPGNVRELENAMIRASALCKGESPEITKEHIFQDHESGESIEVKPLHDAVEDFEGHYIRKALSRAGFHRQKTADMLGISRKTLWEKMKIYKIGENEQ